MANTKSNKPRGPVRLTAETASPVVSKTANPQRKPVNQAQGPRTGNTGNTGKQKTFLEEKSDRNSYFQGLADMVSGALSRRGWGMKPDLEQDPQDKAALTSLKGDWGRARRGPTKGNR